MLDVLCPSCGASTTVEQAAAGVCPACGTALVGNGNADAPLAETAGLTPLEPAPPAAPAQAAQPPRRSLIPPQQDGMSDDGGEDVVEKVSFGDDGEQVDGDMDMTPMVDVTFLLLIFFMVTASFSLQKSIQVPKPEQTDLVSTNFEEREEENQDLITVIIDQFNTFRVQTADFEEEAPSRHELLRKLRRARDEAPGGNPPSKLLVKAHAEAFHEHTVTALDAGVEVGMDSIQLMVVEEDL